MSEDSVSEGAYKNRNGILERGFAALTVVTMQTVYMKFQPGQVSLILSVLLVMVVFMLVCKYGIHNVNQNLLFWVCANDAIFLLIPLCHMLFLPSDSINYSALMLITALFTVFFTLCVLYFSNGEGVIRAFFDNVADTVVAITLISVCLYFVGQTLHIIHPTNSVTITWGGTREIDSYFYLLFTPQGEPYHSFQSGRFTGVFAEAPMNAFMLCLTLIVTLLISKKKINLFRIALLVLSIYVVASATGYIVAASTIGCYILLQRPKSKKIRLLKAFLSSVIGLFLLYTVYAIYRQKVATDVGSVGVRNMNLQNAMGSFLDSPIFGNGFKSDTIGITTGDTSVITQVLQQGGILFALWYFVPVVVTVLHFILDKNINFVSAILLYVLMLFVTTMTYTGLSVVVVAIFLVISCGLHTSNRLLGTMQDKIIS